MIILQTDSCMYLSLDLQEILAESWKATKGGESSDREVERDRQLLIAVARSKDLETQLLAAKEDKVILHDILQ